MKKEKKESKAENQEDKVGFVAIEKKWQEKWEKEGCFEVKEDSKKKKCYVLEMFAYPSAAGLHMGHTFNYTIGDVFARFKIMQGFNVLHPVGYDSLGLPAENAAIKEGIHPGDYTNSSIKNFMKQQKKLGLTYDWARIIDTADSEYYKWDQWIFLKMFEKGLAYQKEAAVNFCNKCNTVLANEQAQGGECDRCESKVEIKQLNQWFFKITDYADRLLDGHKKLNWPEKTIAMQKNWIGKSHGIEIDFLINGEKWPIFTTRPDTIFGVTFMVISSQHKRLFDLVTKEQKKEVEKFLKKLGSVSEKELEDMEKEGVFTGSYAINPATNEKVPVYAGNFVVADYGSGMVMAVPCHDQRDFEFAKKYKISIKQVIAPTFVTTSGKDTVRKDKKTEERNSIFAIVKHWREDKYFLLDWKKFGWKSFVIGGVDAGEKSEDAAIREVKEETGYADIKKITEIGPETHGYYYAEHKDINRYAKFRAFLVELRSDKREKIEEEHTKNHEGVWIDKNSVNEFLNLLNNKYIWDIYSKGERAFTEEGTLVNSKEFNGINSKEAIEKISDFIEKKKFGRKTINYKLRDWCISRQRYWGTPIPLIRCEECGIVPVPEKDLPVKLPKEVKFGKGNPLLTNEKWLNVKCPKCGKLGRRETDTMDTFVNSSWYFLRFCDTNNKERIFDEEKVKYWMPIDLYIGGAEHACMHLIFCRFYTMFLHDIGLIGFDEPAPRLFHQGMINDEKGEKMSKSKGNVVEPLETMAKYGVDTTRFFMLSEASADKGFNWSDKSIQGSLRFVQKIYRILGTLKFGKDSEELSVKLNKTIKDVTEQIEKLDYRKATLELRALFEMISSEKEISKESFEKALKLLSPFCPHISEELWSKIGNKGFISLAEWPKYEEIKENKKNENMSDRIIGSVKPIIEKLNKAKKISKVYIYVMPFELKSANKEKIEKALGKPTQIFAVNDDKKYDPENWASKAKPGKPGIFVE